MLKEYFIRDYNSKLIQQLIYAFFIGLISGPISLGVKYFITFIIIFEIIIFYYTQDLEAGYRSETRIYVNVAAVLGYFISRYIFLNKVLC